MLFMGGDNTISGWEANTTDYGDHGLLTDISLTLTNMSSENRAKRRQQKLRQDLVREHFEQEQRPKTRLQSILSKLSNS
jgi:hypothetical protein